MNKELEKRVIDSVDSNLNELLQIRTYLYENPEVGGEEEKSSAILIKALMDRGFDIEANYKNIDYCFKAVYDSGKPGPVIGITAEYDALPEIGHGCGHNIIATASLGAAFAIKEIINETGGKVILYGTPAEECFVRKADLCKYGAFDELDIAMTVHPNPTNISSGKTTALDALQVDFHGRAAHAGAHPEDGINALDAAVHFYTLIGFEKQYLKDTNIYGVFASAGEKSNVIPDFAAVKFLLRAKNAKALNGCRDLFKRCAEGASAATGATYRIWNNEPGNLDVVTNDELSCVFNKYYEELGGGKMVKTDLAGSTDMGDVSHVVPTIHPWIGLGCPDINLHSKEFADMTITEAGDRAVELGAKALALTALEVLTDKELLEKIKHEFEISKKEWE